MFVKIINDCSDPNAAGRQEVLAARLFPHTQILSVTGVNNDFEAGLNLIDFLTQSDGKPGIITANVAPRNGTAKKWPNGTPFCYFYIHQTLVIASLDGQTLALVRKLKLTEQVQLLELPTVINSMVGRGLISGPEGERIAQTQFRSLEFVLRAAYWLTQKEELPSQSLPINQVGSPQHAIYLVDKFGNCKSGITPTEINYRPGETRTIIVDRPKWSLRRRRHHVKCYQQLREVPDNQLGLTIGSSGDYGHPLIEIVVQGASAAKQYGLRSGQHIHIE